MKSPSPLLMMTFPGFLDQEMGDEALFGDFPEVVAQLLGIPGRIETQVGIEPLGPGVMEIQPFPQHFMPPGRLHLVSHSGLIQFGAIEIGPGMLLPGGQHRPYRRLLGISGIFQP